MLALYNVLTRAEEQEGTCAVGALRLTLGETLVTDKRGLLVTRESTDVHALERAIRDLAVLLGGRDDLREHRCLDTEELEQDGVPLQILQVHEQRARRVGHVADVDTTVDTTS